MRKAIIIILSVLLSIGAIVGGWYFFLREKPKEEKPPQPPPVSETDIHVEDIEDVDSEQKTADKTVSVITPSENVDIVSDNRTGEKIGEITEPILPVYTEDTESPIAEEKKYVQDANFETGVSWDGESAILYRLMSGETTYEKTYGAYYEIRPDEWVLLEKPTPKEEWDGTCNHCGKIAGDGTNGTCVRWMMSDQVCPNCKAEVPVNTCHTCKED